MENKQKSDASHTCKAYNYREYSLASMRLNIFSDFNFNEISNIFPYR